MRVLHTKGVFVFICLTPELGFCCLFAPELSEIESRVP